MKSEIPSFEPHVFVYGSLMDPAEVAKTIRCTLSEANSKMKMATLAGWRRSYTKKSPKWGGNVLNIEPSPDKVVNGVLLSDLTKDQFKNIERREAGYAPRLVSVKTGGRTVRAVVFVSNPEAGVFSQKYIQFVDRAARGYGDEFYQKFKESF